MKKESAEKNREKWNDLWGQWKDVVSEIGDEDGKYVSQDEEWESPCFDGSAVAEDLEAIAVKMLPLVEEIYAAGTENKDIFLQAVEDIEHNINSYPEWMGADNEGVGLEANTVRCLLKWEWLAAGSVGVFLDRLITWESRLKLVDVREDSIIEFLASLSEDTQREAFEYIRANRNRPVWNKELGSPRSRWHRLYHVLAQKFDRLSGKKEPA